MKDYKKDYKGFVIWFLGLIVAVFATAFIPTEDGNLMALVIDNIMTIAMAVLTYMIYKNERIYWYTGLSYEDALKVTSEQRKAYAFLHFKRFAIFAVLYFVYSVVAYLFHVPLWVNITVVLLGIVGVAISTIKIKLEN